MEFSEFDLERKSIALIQPPIYVFTEGKYEFGVVRPESGGLGFLFVSKSDCSTQLWKRKTDGVASWVLERTIDRAVPGAGQEGRRPRAQPNVSP